MSDAYVGAMNGVILSLSENVTIVDVSHEVERHNVNEAAYVLASASAYYPSNTVHVAVVDPGVGSSRRALILRTPQGTYVSPDNGTLTHILNQHGAAITDAESNVSPRMVNVPKGFQAFQLDRPEFWLPNLTNTFHGRDVFAPAAARLANGVSPSELGSPVHSVVCLPIPALSTSSDKTTGAVVHIDTYGNLVTNITPDTIPDYPEVHVAGRVIEGLSESYAKAPDSLLAIVGSRHTLEIAVGKGNAQDFLNASVGDRVVVGHLKTSPKPCPD